VGFVVEQVVAGRVNVPGLIQGIVDHAVQCVLQAPPAPYDRAARASHNSRGSVSFENAAENVAFIEVGRNRAPTPTNCVDGVRTSIKRAVGRVLAFRL
jgi:hypothetical protein